MRILLDENMPPKLREQLQDRGYPTVHLNDLKQNLLRPGETSVPDDRVIDEAKRVPSVIVTLDVRDFSSLPLYRYMAQQGVTVVIVRVPKAAKTPTEKAQAILDSVHRFVHRFETLARQGPRVVSVNRQGLRTRTLHDLL